jgi:hypothetical protein
MSNSQLPSFVHRRNRDGSFDSICPQCAATAAKAAVEEDLCEGERNHTCDKYLLETRLRHMTQPPLPAKPSQEADS